MKIGRCLAVLLIVITVDCSMGIKCIENYRRNKREIHSINCITKVHFVKVIDDKNKPTYSWNRIPSEGANKFAENKIREYVNFYSKKKFEIIQDTFQIDSVAYARVRLLSAQLDTVNKIDSIKIDERLIESLKEIKNDNVLIISQEGYHFSRDYMDAIETRENLLSLLSVASVATAVAYGGVGYAFISANDKGRSIIFVMFINKKQNKVLYYSKRLTSGDIFADSTIIDQMSSMFAKF
jgi:hypothetical protein